LPSHALDVLPHEVFAPELVALREVIDPLVLANVLQIVVQSLTGPHDVPLTRIGAHNSDTSVLQRIHDRVVNVRRVRDFEPKRAILVHEILLRLCLGLLKWQQGPLTHLHEALALLHRF
jgi:hypothetical protein